MILIPFWGYSLCLLNLGIDPNKILRLGKKSRKLGKYRPVLGLGSSLYLAVKKANKITVHCLTGVLLVPSLICDLYMLRLINNQPLLSLTYKEFVNHVLCLAA